MAKPDQTLIDMLAAGDRLSLAQLAALSPEQLETLRVLALAQIAFDPGAPSAARVAALKGFGNAEPGTGEPDKSDPGDMDLDAINRELRLLDGT